VGLSAHQKNGGHDEWLTPPEILLALGPFDLDPCAPIVRPWETAARHYTVQDNGLALPWAGRVWCNPPFGREAVKWLRRMADHGNGVALIPARTETAMFYETVWGAADGVLFIKGRPHFHYVDGRRAAFNSGAPIALVAYGSANLDALRLDPNAPCRNALAREGKPYPKSNCQRCGTLMRPGWKCAEGVELGKPPMRGCELRDDAVGVFKP